MAQLDMDIDWNQGAPTRLLPLIKAKDTSNVAALNQISDSRADDLIEVLATWQSPSTTGIDWAKVNEDSWALLAAGCLDWRLAQLSVLNLVQSHSAVTAQSLGDVVGLIALLLDQKWDISQPKRNRPRFVSQTLAELLRWYRQAPQAMESTIAAIVQKQGEDCFLVRALATARRHALNVDADWPQELVGMLDASKQDSAADSQGDAPGNPKNGPNNATVSTQIAPNSGVGAGASASAGTSALASVSTNVSARANQFPGDTDAALRDRKRQLANVYEVFRQNSPLCTEALALNRIAVWHDVDAAPDAKDDGETALTAPSPDQRQNYLQAVNAPPAETIEAWVALEKTLSVAPFWLDGHALAIQYAQQVGHVSGGIVIASLVESLLGRLPALKTLKFKDGTAYLSDADYFDTALKALGSADGGAGNGLSEPLGVLPIPPGLDELDPSQRIAQLEAALQHVAAQSRHGTILTLHLAAAHGDTGNLFVAHSLVAQCQRQFPLSVLTRWEPDLASLIQRTAGKLAALKAKANAKITG